MIIFDPKFKKGYVKIVNFIFIIFQRILVVTRYCADIGFLLDFHHYVDRLRIDYEVT